MYNIKICVQTTFQLKKKVIQSVNVLLAWWADGIETLLTHPGCFQLIVILNAKSKTLYI